MAKDERKSRTRSMIVKAALRQFSLHGFAATSANAIAADAGVAHGTIFWHFENKSRLYEEVVRHVGQQVATVIQAHAGGASRSLAAVLQAWADFLRNDPDFAGFLVGIGGDAKDPSLSGHPERLLSQTLVDSWNATLSSLEGLGALPPRDRHAFARLIMATSYGALVTDRGAALGDVFGLLSQIGSSMATRAAASNALREGAR